MRLRRIFLGGSRSRVTAAARERGPPLGLRAVARIGDIRYVPTLSRRDVRPQVRTIPMCDLILLPGIPE